MKRLIAAAVLSLLCLSAYCAGPIRTTSSTTNTLNLNTWIVIGDSIGSFVAQGTPNQHFLKLVANERNISIRNLSSPGASLGSSDNTGFNSATTINAIAQISGAWGYYSGVIVQAGTNDFKRGISVDKTIEGLRRILAKVRADGRKAVVMDPIYRDGEEISNGLNDSLCVNIGNTLNCYRFYMRTVCESEYADVCRFALRSGSVMGVFNNNYDSSEVSTNTRTHPNATGHRALADWLKAEAAAAGFF